jgi:hypothetical protein
MSQERNGRNDPSSGGTKEPWHSDDNTVERRDDERAGPVTDRATENGRQPERDVDAAEPGDGSIISSTPGVGATTSIRKGVE